MEGEDKVVQIVEDLSNIVNGYNVPTVAVIFAEEWDRQHRTLQQGFGRVVVEWIKQNAVKYAAGNYDLRNEATCRLCHEIVSKVDPRFLALPLI